MLKDNDRKIEYIFIGNIENNLQDNTKKEKKWGKEVRENK